MNASLVWGLALILVVAGVVVGSGLGLLMVAGGVCLIGAAVL